MAGWSSLKIITPTPFKTCSLFFLGFTPLAYAVQSEQLHAVKRLVKMGANIDSQDAAGRTCLSVAAYQVCETLMYLPNGDSNQLRIHHENMPMQIY